MQVSARQFAFIVLPLSFAGMTSAQTIHVSTCGNDAWSGVSTVCQAPDGPLASVQAAMDAAVNGVDVFVAPGLYVGDVDFLGKDVWLHSTSGERQTILNGTVYCMSGESPQAIFEGFTVTHFGQLGRGMQVHDSSPTIRHCTFQRNKVINSFFGGGGMAVIGPNGPSITYCTFNGNDSEGQPSAPGCRSNGGGLSVRSVALTIRGCVFSSNRAFGVCDIGPVPYGGGILVEPFTGASLVVIGCSFAGNLSAGLGAFSNAIYAGAPVEMKNCALGAAQAVGGAIVEDFCYGLGLFLCDPGPGPDLSWGTPDDDYGDLRPRPGSSCIDAGDNTDVPRGMVLDMDGNPRFMDDCGSVDTGVPGGTGGSAIVDVGAFEFQGATGIENYCTTSPNGVGAGALISCEGSPSVSANDLVLEAGPIATGMGGLFFHGDAQTFLPFGNGYQCVGGNAVRAWPLVSADASGQMRLTLDNTSIGGLGIAPGVTRHFQAWYRDDSGASSFNLSDGLSVTFLP